MSRIRAVIGRLNCPPLEEILSVLADLGAEFTKTASGGWKLQPPPPENFGGENWNEWREKGLAPFTKEIKEAVAAASKNW